MSEDKNEQNKKDIANINFYVFEEQERRKTPEAFLFNSEEALLIDRVIMCLSKANVLDPDIDTYQGEKNFKQIELIKAQSIEALKNIDIDIEEIKKIINKFDKNKYWSIWPYISKDDPIEYYHKFNGNSFLLYTSINKVKKVSLPPDHEFYIAKTMQERAEALHINKKSLYVSSFELYFYQFFIALFSSTENSKAKALPQNIKKPLPLINSAIFMNDSINKAILEPAAQVKEGKDDNGIEVIERGYAASQGGGVMVGFSLVQPNNDLKYSTPYTQYSAALDNAIGSIVERVKELNNGQFQCITFTKEELWRVMAGTQDKKKHPTPLQLEEIKSELKKAAITLVKGDITSELKRLKIPNDRFKEGYIEDNRLHIKEVYLTTEKGRVISCYQLLSEPILLGYNKLKTSENNKTGHVIYLPLNVLEAGGNDKQAIEIKQYLLQRVIAARCRLNEGLNERILYNSMYANGVSTPEDRAKNIQPQKEEADKERTYKSQIRKYKKQDREDVIKILEHWKAINLILDYYEIQEGTPQTDFKALHKAVKNNKAPTPKKGLAFIGVDILQNPNAPQFNTKAPLLL